MRPYEEPEETRSARKKVNALEKEFQNAIDNGLKSLAKTRDGRAYLRYLLFISKAGQQPFTGVRETTDFNCGELNIGNQVLAHLLTVAPNTYLKLKQEEEQDNDRRIKQRDANRNTGNSSDGDTDRNARYD